MKVLPKSYSVWWRDWQWVVVLMLGFVAFVLGLIGFASQDLRVKEKNDTAELIYRTLKLFLLDVSNAKAPLNLSLDIARFLAPTVLGYTTLVAFGVLLRDQFQLMRVRWMRRHAVVCGLGRKGLELVRGFCGKGMAVVVIEPDEENDLINPAREAGAIVLVGDAADAGLLERAGTTRASRLFAVTGSEGTNVEIALRAQELLKRGQGSASRPVAFVHVMDPELRTLFRRRHVLTRGAMDVKIFDYFENCARRLFHKYPLDRVRIGANDHGRRVHLVVVGLGRMGQSLLVQAARVGHFANRNKLMVTVVDPAAPRLERVLDHRYPQFKQVCETQFLAMDLEDSNVIKRLQEWGREADTIETFALCTDNDSRTLTLALHLLPHLQRYGIPVLARMSSQSGLATLLRQGDGTSNGIGLIRPFGMLEDICTPDAILQEEVDLMARAIHDDYVRRRRSEGAPENDLALQPWESLDEDLRDSCRNQADHIPVKLRAAGYRSGKIGSAQGPVESFTSDEIELMAEMEHRRWCAERFLAGWRFAPGDKNIVEKTNPRLIDWDALTDKIREFDRQAVRNIPTLLELTGEAVYRI